MLLFDLAAIFVPCFWAGLVVGVSFVATPVKFRAETLELGPALDVGRHTFLLFNKVEWSVLAVLIALAFIKPLSLLQPWFVAPLVVILLLQTFWLLPELTLRAEAIIAGAPRERSLHHTFYAGLEVVKLLTVSFIGISAIIALIP